MKPRLSCGGSWPLLLGLLAFFSSPLISEATCPTRFYAQAITPARAAEIDVYFSRAQIPNAAECATLCGRRDFCKSAVFNHDSKSCALSYDIVVECKKKTERYNTFHLTSEGADSISLLSCVDLCDKEKTQFQAADTQSAKSTSFSRNEAPKVVQKSSDLTTRTQEATDRSEAEGGGGGGLRGHGDRGSFITLTRGVAAKTVGSGEQQQPAGEAPSNAILEALQRLVKTVDSQLQNSTADRPGAVIRRVGAETTLETDDLNGKKPKQRGETSSKSPAVTREFGAQIFDLPDLRQTAKAEERREEAAIKGAEAKHKAEDEEAKRKKKADGKKELNAADLITTATGHKRVAFHAAPLGVQEVFNGTTNSSSSGRGHVFKTGGQADSHRGGFFARASGFSFRPTSSCRPNSPLWRPELFALATSNETADGSAPTKKTITRFAKISVAPGEPKGTATVREVFDKKGASIPIGGEKKSSESETKTAESMDPVVVNGRLLSADEIRSLLTREQSTTTTTTTAKPWKPASQLFGASDEDEEDSSETTTTEKLKKKKKPEDSSASDSSAAASSKRDPHRRPQHDEKADGFLNTFLISGISSMIHGADGESTKEDEREEANEKIRLSRLGTSNQGKSRPAFPAESQETEAKTSTRPPPTTSTTPLPTTTPFVLQTTSTASGPIVCYRQIPQQILLYAAFETIHDISLNECRCRCAQTWLNMTVGPKCKSVLYNEVNRECSLNQGDHNGKYDLIYDKFVDYHYVSCDIKYLLSAAKRVCSRILPTMNLFFARPKLPAENRTEETGADDSQPMNSSEQKRAKDPKIAALGIAKIDELENPADKQTSKRIESITPAPSTSTSPEPTTSTTPVPSTTTTKADDLLIQEVTYTTANTRPPLFSSTTFFSTASTGGGDDSDLLIQEVRSTAASDASASTDAAESTARTVSTKWKEETVVTSTVPSTTTTSYDILTISGHTDRCFEVIPGFMMRSTAGGLEHNVTMSECECHCANSLNSKRYSFQCLSATYYHNERDCVLNLDSRELSTELFMKSAPEENQHTRKGECPRTAPPAAPSTTTTTERTTTLAVHTDNCFLELPHYVLEGTALAVESNVTVDECKCFCVDSAHRYGSECQSVEYYYDTQTCLLNKENRVSDPDRFNYEPHGVLHSYFDYRCHSEKMILSVYVEQVCRKFIDVRIDEIEPTSSSLDVDDEERENEVRLVTQTQLPYGSKEVLTFGGRRHKAEGAEGDEKPRRWVKTLKFVNEDEDATSPMPLGLSPIEPEAKKEGEDDGEDSKGAKADGREQDEDESDEEEAEERRSGLTQRRPRQRHRDPAGQQSGTNESEEDEEVDAVERKRKRKLRNEQKQKAAKSTTTTSTTTTTEEPAESTEIEAEVEAESTPTTTEEPSTTTTEEAAHSTIVQSADSEESVEQTPLPPLPPPTTTKPRAGRRGNIAEIEELEGEEELKKWEATSTTTAAPTTSSTTTTQATTTTRPKPRSTSPVSTTTSTTTTTTTSRPYLLVGNCRYSALYQTAFNGERLIRRFRVQTALQCFSGCHWERCRSANLIHTGGSAKFCELYRDSIVDFRRTDVLYFDRDTVHFDSIHCQEA
ncbi:PAN-1 domain and Apple-like domain-containing protein [Aphelenchoides fujianensis]|nr:PAN-1 domain and Apple-like domain-containing protein [Aphelenchoides fujianensis]